MRSTAAIVVGLALAATAHADSRTQSLVPGFEKEARNCRIHADGVGKVLDGAKALLAGEHDDALAADAQKLHEAHDTIQKWCDELAATLDLLHADPAATYKSLERQLGEHDNKIRALRQASMKAVDDVQPIIQRLVPRINQHSIEQDTANAPGSPPKPPEPPKQMPPPPAAPTPPPPQTTAEISLGVRAFTGGTCEQQAEMYTANAEHESWEKQSPRAGAKREPWSLGWLPGARWKVSYVLGDRFFQIECVPSKRGGYLVTLDEADQQRPTRDLLEVTARMLGVLGSAPP
ncbi:MAG: hypothetical protein ACM31C_01855 [Acidobacteriota bacterium]